MCALQGCYVGPSNRTPEPGLGGCCTLLEQKLSEHASPPTPEGKLASCNHTCPPDIRKT